MVGFPSLSKCICKLLSSSRCGKKAWSGSSASIQDGEPRTKNSSEMPENKSFRRSSSIVLEARYEFDVFLSFRGEDTRHGFTQRLYEELGKKSIRTFLDNEELHRGEKIGPKLMKSIEGSEIFVTIFLPGYAESRWCLMELSQIVECHRLIVPVFVHVDPLTVQTQNGSYGSRLPGFEKRFGVEDVNKWREALKVSGEAPGFEINDDGNEKDVIKRIIKRVMEKLKNPPLHLPENLVGIKPRVEDIMGLVKLDANDVMMVAIHGEQGIGKTTLAKAIYNGIFTHFDAFFFFADVKSALGRGNLVDLQITLVSELTKAEKPRIGDVDEGISLIKDTVSRGRVLIVIDDVDHESQLKALAGEKAWFHPGSIIIITTEHESLLNDGMHHKYALKELDGAESLHLFKIHAFPENSEPSQDLFELAREAASLCKGIPGKLERLGRFLSDKTDAEEWEETLEKKKRYNSF